MAATLHAEEKDCDETLFPDRRFRDRVRSGRLRRR